jgi:hypothetical protein
MTPVTTAARGLGRPVTVAGGAEEVVAIP